jgi:tyrosyl-DNA phosphodiesterase-1
METVIVLDDSDDETIAMEKKAEAVHSLRSLLGDRAEMERERLKRRRQQRRDQGLPSDEEQVEHKRKMAEGLEEAHDQKKTKRASRDPAAITTDSPTSSAASNNAPLYWNGAVKKSYNVYCTQTPGTRFEEFLRPTTSARAHGLTHVLMATYCEDIEWLARMFPRGSDAPEITMVTLAQGELRAGVYAPLHPQLPNWIRLVVSRKGLTEWTTMHMKFILLFYPDRLRLVALSGNMVEYDWSRIENTAFIHDFHKLDDAKTDEDSEYHKAMSRVLSSLSVPAGHFARRSLKLYDMSSTCEARMVISMPTTAPVSGWNAIEEVGIGRLAKVVRDILGDGKQGNASRLTIEAQGSSMGSYSPRWLQHMHIVCSGHDYRRILPLPAATAKANLMWAKVTGCTETEKWPPVRLLFPSDRWVKTQAIEGVPGAGTFFGKKKAAVEKGFVQLLHQPVSVRGNIMMHHKAILAITEGADVVEWSTPPASQRTKQTTLGQKEGPTNTEIGESDIIGWAYMGSHNLTQAAWGSITQPKQTNSPPQMTIGNWELGIVVPVRKADLEQDRHVDSMAANIITWKRPCEPYRPGDVPWDQFAQ